jgi:hypothetical protein
MHELFLSSSKAQQTQPRAMWDPRARRRQRKAHERAAGSASKSTNFVKKLDTHPNSCTPDKITVSPSQQPLIGCYSMLFNAFRMLVYALNVIWRRAVKAIWECYMKNWYALTMLCYALRMLWSTFRFHKIRGFAKSPQKVTSGDARQSGERGVASIMKHTIGIHRQRSGSMEMLHADSPLPPS